MFFLANIVNKTLLIVILIIAAKISKQLIFYYYSNSKAFQFTIFIQSFFFILFILEYLFCSKKMLVKIAIYQLPNII